MTAPSRPILILLANSPREVTGRAGPGFTPARGPQAARPAPPWAGSRSRARNSPAVSIQGGNSGRVGAESVANGTPRQGVQPAASGRRAARATTRTEQAALLRPAGVGAGSVARPGATREMGRSKQRPDTELAMSA